MSRKRANTEESTQVSKRAKFESEFVPAGDGESFNADVPNKGSKSLVQLERMAYQPTTPAVLRSSVKVLVGAKTTAVADPEEIAKLFPNTFGQPSINLVPAEDGKQPAISDESPLRVGVVLSGGQAPGGHNVIAAIFDYVKSRNANSQLFGFLAGPRGVFKGQYVELTHDRIDAYRNQGGFDIIGSGRDKIKTPEQIKASINVCNTLDLHGLIIIGGDDSNTNAAILAEEFVKHGCATRVIGCPKTIDGDLRNEQIETSFGFDTACKVYSELIGNICLDVNSTKKYYHFIRLMGRSASHITLECALQTRPTLALIGEEVQQKNISLAQITTSLCDLIVARAAAGKNFGVVLVPEGLIEFVPEVGRMIAELNDLLSHGATAANVAEKLTPASAAAFALLPGVIRDQLMLERDPHGNVQVSKIETERLLILMCTEELEKRRAAGRYNGQFSALSHFFGYEGRSALPSGFDSDYCYALGNTAAHLIDFKVTGYMAVVNDLHLPGERWRCGGYPITAMMNVERRHGEFTPVIKKALVELDSKVYKVFEAVRDTWAMADCFRSPGPLQFGGPTAHVPSYTVAPPTIEEAGGGARASGASTTWSSKVVDDYSAVQVARLSAPLQLPNVLQGPVRVVERSRLLNESEDAQVASISANLPRLALRNNALYEVESVAQSDAPVTPMNIGVVFCGRQAPGGHSIVSGLLRYVQTRAGGGRLLGILGGTHGLFKKEHVEITEAAIAPYINQGGYDILGRTADKIRSPKEQADARAACEALNLDALVLVGGPTTATDAAYLTEFFISNDVKTRVVVVPASVDFEVKHTMLEANVGFDTACKVYSQLIGNIMTDAASALKYYYFIRLMGRSPSHVVLECALQTHPNVCIIGEEAAKLGQTLDDIVQQIANAICQRAARGVNFGTVLVPEGLLLHLTHFKQLIQELNAVLASTPKADVASKLTPWSAALLQALPSAIVDQLLMERESLGTTQLSQIETERLLADMVGIELAKRKAAGRYAGSYATVTHFFGYQGRGSLPSVFDCALGATYGFTAGVLAASGLTGVTVTARGLTSALAEWRCGGVPLTALMNLKHGQSAWGVDRVAIEAVDVDLKSRSFRRLERERGSWVVDDKYRNPGPIQFYGRASALINITLHEEHSQHLQKLKQVEALAKQIQKMCSFGAHEDVIAGAASGLQSLVEMLQLLERNTTA